MEVAVCEEKGDETAGVVVATLVSPHSPSVAEFGAVGSCATLVLTGYQLPTTHSLPLTVSPA